MAWFDSAPLNGLIFALFLIIIVWLIVRRKTVKGGTVIENVTYPKEDASGSGTEYATGATSTTTSSNASSASTASGFGTAQGVWSEDTKFGQYPGTPIGGAGNYDPRTQVPPMGRPEARNDRPKTRRVVRRRIRRDRIEK